MNVVIIEDENLAARNLKRLLHEIDPSINVMNIIDSVKESVEWLAAHAPTLIFLDIHLSDGPCFNIFEKVDVHVPVIFTTAYDQYALKAFKVNSIDYLLKPIDKEELASAINKFRRYAYDMENEGFNFKGLLEQLKGKDYKQRFVINIANKIKTLAVEDIAYFFVNEKNNFFSTRDGKHYPLEYSLDRLEKMVDPSDFFRVSRQFMVNIKAIQEVQVYSKSRLKLILEPPFQEDVFVSFSKSPDFRKWLDR
jgi:DNA-binding LytR/AlgR family response regulator